MKSMKKPYLALLTLVGLILTSCGDSDGNHTYSYQEFESIVVTSSNSFSDQVKGASISLNAPQGLALVIKRDTITSKSLLGTCTAFLVDKKTVMTNSHCIPDELKENGSKNCAEYLGFVVKDRVSQQSKFCKKVKFFSHLEDSTKNPDYALVELDSEVRDSNSFSVARAGIDSGEITEVHSFDAKRVGNQVFGNYRKSTCVSYEKSIIGSFLDNRSTIVPVFKNNKEAFNCSVIPGNSGSPAVKRGTRQAVGVIYAGQTKKFMQSYRDKEIDFSKINKFGLMSNFACLDIPGFNRYRQWNCEEFLKQEEQAKEDYRNQIVADSRIALESEIAEVFSKVPKTFLYNNIAKDKAVINPSPKCMVPLERWPQEELDKIERTGFLYRNKSYKVTVPSVKIDFSLDVNEFGVFKESIAITKIVDKVVEITDVDDVFEQSSKVGQVTMPMSVFRSIREVDLPLETRLCTDEELQKNGL